jgi:hypothetical protein
MTHPPFRPPVIHDDDDEDESDLVNVPRSFIHDLCGKRTYMNAATVRHYHRDPFWLASQGDEAWCAGCQADCWSADCRWVETGGNMRTYLRGLVAEEHIAHPRAWIQPLLPRLGRIVGLTLLIAVGIAARGVLKGHFMLAAIVVAVGLSIALIATIIIAGPKYLSRRALVKEYLREFGPPTYPPGIVRV